MRGELFQKLMNFGYIFFAAILEEKFDGIIFCWALDFTLAIFEQPRCFMKFIAPTTEI